MIKDISDAVSERIKAPLYRYVILAFVAINWKGFFFLVMTNGAPALRWTAFESHTSFEGLYIWPVVVGLALTLIGPWTRLVFDWVSNKPLTESRLMAIRDKHNDQQANLELERVIAERNKNKELELLRQAKMSQKIESSNFSDKEKIELNNNIDKIRERSIIENSLGKYEFFNIISKYSLTCFDIAVIHLLLDGPITIHSRARYLKAVTLGIIQDGLSVASPIQEKYSYGGVYQSLMLLMDSQLVDMIEVAIDIENYHLTNHGVEFANFMDGLEGTDRDEMDLILDSNEEGYVTT